MPENLVIVESFSKSGRVAVVHKTEDSLKGFLSISKSEKKTKEGDPQITVEEWEVFESALCARLEEILDEDNIDVAVLRDILEKAKKDSFSPPRRIIKGRAPISGRDGKLLLLVKPYSEPETRLGYNFKTRLHKRFDTVAPEDIIAREYHPKPGQDGRDIFGKKIPSEIGTTAGFSVSDGLSVENGDDYNRVVSNDHGYIKYAESKLSLETVLHITSDVDHDTGSIHFTNAVDVAGSVKEGFVVRASGDIRIHGRVNNSEIFSSNGGIKIDGAILTGEVSDDSVVLPDTRALPKLRAHQDIELTSVYGHAVISESDVIITDSCVRSFVSAAGSVVCKKSIYASIVQVACGLDTVMLGNDIGAPTRVNFIHPVEGSREYRDLERKAKKVSDEIEKLQLYLGPLVSSVSSDVGREKSEFKNSLLLLKSKMEEADVLQASMKQLLEDSRKITKSYLSVQKRCFQNVEVFAGESRYYFSDPREKAFTLVYDWEQDSFSEQELIPIQCSYSKEDDNGH